MVIKKNFSISEYMDMISEALKEAEVDGNYYVEISVLTLSEIFDFLGEIKQVEEALNIVQEAKPIEDGTEIEESDCTERRPDNHDDYKNSSWCDLCYYKGKSCGVDCTRERRPICFKTYRKNCNILCSFCIHWEECRDETKAEIL